MGFANVESDLRAALSCAPLSDAALGDIVNTVLTIISDAIEPGSRMGVTISSSHTSLQATTNGAVKAMFEVTTPARAATAGEYDGVSLPYDNTPDRARAAGVAADQTFEIPGLMSPHTPVTMSCLARGMPPIGEGTLVHVNRSVVTWFYW
jgi:hypothetical protein